MSVRWVDKTTCKPLMRVHGDDCPGARHCSGCYGNGMWWPEHAIGVSSLARSRYSSEHPADVELADALRPLERKAMAILRGSKVRHPDAKPYRGVLAEMTMAFERQMLRHAREAGKEDDQPFGLTPNKAARGVLAGWLDADCPARSFREDPRTPVQPGLDFSQQRATPDLRMVTEEE